MKTPLEQRYAEQAAAERAEREARERGEEYHDIWATPRPEEKKRDDREPGLWVDAFWEGLKKDLDPGVHPTDFTRNPTAYLHLINEPARTEADDEGNLK